MAAKERIATGDNAEGAEKAARKLKSLQRAGDFPAALSNNRPNRVIVKLLTWYPRLELLLHE